MSNTNEHRTHIYYLLMQYFKKNHVEYDTHTDTIYYRLTTTIYVAITNNTMYFYKLDKLTNMLHLSKTISIDVSDVQALMTDIDRYVMCYVKILKDKGVNIYAIL